MDILKTLQDNIDDFNKGSIKIVGAKTNGSVRYGGSEDDTGYMFSQKEMIDTIDLYYNSKYEKGNKDSQGQRKLFLNKVKFAQNVAEKQTDVDVANYNFIPDHEKDSNKVWFIKRKFIVWTREHDYGQLLNELNKDFSKYGACVLRKRKDKVERISLRKLMNTQDATSLKQAPLEGGYVIVEHDLSYYQMKQMPDWNLDDIEKFKGTKKVYEMYSLMGRGELDGTDDEEEVLTVSYLCPDFQEYGDDTAILFLDEIDEVPFEEAHWDKQDGRWMGVGVVEDLIENQIAANLTANLRRKHLLWGAKKLFQTQGDAVAKNLAKEVQDGDVLEVGVRGEITPVPTESRNLAEFSANDQTWDSNGEQKTFTFEVSSGETLPSGTPFRLGVLMSNSAARHFDLKRENFGLFLYRSFFSQLMPIFKKQTKEHNVAVMNGEDGAEFVKEAVILWNAERRYNAQLLNGTIPNFDLIRDEVAEEIDKKAFMFVNVPEGYYNDAQFYMQLDITRQEENTDATMATLTTLYQTLAQRGDPRADKILDQIIGLTGKNPNKVLGSQEVRQEVTQIQPNPQANLQGLTAQNGQTA